MRVLAHSHDGSKAWQYSDQQQTSKWEGIQDARSPNAVVSQGHDIWKDQEYTIKKWKVTKIEASFIQYWEHRFR